MNPTTKEDNARDYTPISGKIVYILAFVIPLVILVAIYFARGIFPFGEKCYLRSDMYHQYLPFYSELWTKIRNLESLTYSHNIGLGVNFTALYAYYLSCPLNWFIFLFPHQSLIEVMSGLIIFKISLSSVTFTYYIVKRFDRNNIYMAVFGMFYAMSGYLAAYSWNIMWLDCVLLFPLIILGLERLVKEKKGLLYSLTLGLAILTNYYISIMICLTMILYFIYLVLVNPEKKVRGWLINIRNFALYSLLAGGISACLLIPELFALSYTVSSDVSFPKTLTEYFPILEMLTRHLINIEPHLALEHHPNIYCGVGVFVLLPLYIMNNRIPSREKVGKIVLLVIFLVAFNMNIPNFIWHGLHFPNSLPCRQSFIYIFILLTMCYDAFKDITHYTKKELSTALWIALGILLLFEQLFTDSVLDFKVVYISAAFIGVYMLIIYIFQKKSVPYMVFLFMFFTATILECAINFEDTALGTTDRTYYLADNQDISNILTTVRELDDSFYRIEKYSGLKTKNDAAWNDYYSASTFSSTSNGGLSKLYGHLGMESSTNAYSYCGATFLTSALLRVKYVISDKQLIENDLLTYIDSSNDRYIYRNNYILPLGFMVPSNLTEVWDYKNTNPFVVQNNFIRTVTGVEDVFVGLGTNSISNTSVKINVARTQPVYVYVLTKGLDKVNVYINDTSKSHQIRHNHIIDLGVINATDEIRITCDDMDKNLALVAFTINETGFIDAVNSMSLEGLNITDFDETHIEGTINALNDGYMMMSIPYDRGWSIYVDGEKVRQESVNEGLTLVPVPAGEHTIKMNYCPEGLKLGWAITIICAIIFIALFLESRNQFISKRLPKKAVKNANSTSKEDTK